MRVIPLGVGGAFTEKFYHTNYLVELPGCRLLIDAGTTLRYSLPAAGYSVRDIDAIVITHFHSDHAGGLEELSQRCRYIYDYRPKILVMEDQIKLLEALFSLHGVSHERYLNVIKADKVYQFHETEDARYYLEYYSTLGLHAAVTSNYALSVRRIDRQGRSKRLVFSGDLGNIGGSPLVDLTAKTDTAAVFHDCYTDAKPSDAHPSLDEMERCYSPELRGKIFVIHYGDNIDHHQDRIWGAGFQIARQGEQLYIRGE